MSVPLDRLYHFVDSLCGGDVIIYRFYPHGSKKITDLSLLKPWDPGSFSQAPRLICHDQEPLCYDHYADPAILDQLQHSDSAWFLKNRVRPELIDLLLQKNLKLNTDAACFGSQALLLHSEQRSVNVDRYNQSGFLGVYWWSHAIIARDWFRYAEHDTDLGHSRPTKDFLVYNRAWTGTREYRLKFAELVVQANLSQHCHMRFSPQDGHCAYQDHVFHNAAFGINTQLDDHFELNTADATASADYVTQDYQTSGIEVVLETLFDDTRWHLTEKTLRPMACAQPFILAATAGSLQYLRSYGFRTFDPLINESYDGILDPAARLQAIVAEMRRISDLDDRSRTMLFDQLRLIAQHNQQRFFSPDFQRDVVQEFKNNIAQALDHFQTS